MRPQYGDQKGPKSILVYFDFQLNKRCEKVVRSYAENVKERKPLGYESH